MPFDGQKTTLDLSREAFAAASPKARLAMLAAALRRPLPSHFAWDFSAVHYRNNTPSLFRLDDIFSRPENAHCNTAGCALGLAYELWGDAFGSFGVCGGSAAMAAFDLSPDTMDAVFFDTRLYGVERFGDVTPQMVADAIDRHLLGGETDAP